MGSYHSTLTTNTTQATLNTHNNHRMKSKAALRFNRLHPDSLKDFQNILQTAKKRKESSDEESLDDRDEVTNMIKNKMLTKSREEDEVFSETERKKKEAGQQEDHLEQELDRGSDCPGLSLLQHSDGRMNNEQPGGFFPQHSEL